MASKILLLTLISLSSLYAVFAISCYQCDSAVDGDEKCMNKTGLTANPCEQAGDFDMCYKLITTVELPNNGPQDRKSDNAKISRITRGCGTKKEWEHLVKIDRGCDTDSVGGGGTQVRCVCSGNNCNSASQITAGLALIATLSFAKLVL